MKLEEIEKLCDEIKGTTPWIFDEPEEPSPHKYGDLCCNDNPHDEMLKVYPRRNGYLWCTNKGLIEFILKSPELMPKLLAVAMAVKECREKGYYTDLGYSDYLPSEILNALEELEKE